MINSTFDHGAWRRAGALLMGSCLILVTILYARESTLLFEAPFALALLNTVFLCALPLGMAYLAAKSHQATSALGFLVIGCGLVFFGLSSLYAGWVMPLAGSSNPTVTLHNLGSFFAGLCQLAGAHFFLQDVMGIETLRPRLPHYKTIYSGIFGLVSVTAVLAYLGRLPVFFDPLTGPSLLRQWVLGGAIFLFAMAGLAFMEIYFTAKTAFAYWYGLALWLIALGLIAVLLQHGVGSPLGWAGRAAQYLGGLYFGLAFLQGRWERTQTGTLSTTQVGWVLWPYLEQKVTQRTTTLEKEIAERKRAEQLVQQQNEQLQKQNQELRTQQTALLQSETALRQSEATARALLNIPAAAAFLIDPNGTCLDANETLARRFGKRVAEVVGQRIWDLFPPEVSAARQAHFQMVLREKKMVRYEDERLGMWNDSIIAPILDQAGAVSMAVVLGFDITERKQAEEALKRNERILRIFVEHSPASIAMFDHNMNYIVASRRYLVDYELGEQDLTGRSHYEVFPEISERWKEIHRRCLAGAIEKADEDAFPRADGHLDYVHWEIHPWYENAEKIGGVILFSEVITERKRAEETLQKSEAMLNRVQEFAHLGSWEIDLTTHTVIASDEAHRIYGIPKGCLTLEFIQSVPLSEFRPLLDAALSALITQGQRYDVDFKIRRFSDGEVRDIHSLAEYNAARRTIIGSLQDITERKQTEEQIKKSLVEKETLLRELYHRTKNNMAVIIALLELQANACEDPRLQKEFTEAQNRIHSMALVHQKLYDTRDLSHINLKEYSLELIQDLMESYHISPARITVLSELEEVFVLIDSAIPYGLIVNELISNALKYAFPPKRGGEIKIRLYRAESGEIELRIADNGMGIPPGFDFRRDGHLGVQNVFTLGEGQLRGQVVFETHPGVACQLRFQDTFYKPRI